VLRFPPHRQSAQRYVQFYQKILLIKNILKDKSKIWKLIFSVIMILGFITPFIDYFVVIQMFYLLIPFGIIILFSIIIFIANLLKFKKNAFKQNLTLLTFLIPLFLLCQIFSTIVVDKIQRKRSEKIIVNLQEEREKYPEDLNTAFGIKYSKIKNSNDYELKYNRGFFVREIYDSNSKKWKSYGWND